MKINHRVPTFLKSVLWSYDLNQIDLKEDRELVITQVLNYGEWRDLEWLYSVYAEDDIRQVVSHPRRGRWFDKVLNFWEKMLDIRLPKKVRQKALFHIDPQFP